MISKQTATDIALAHRDVETAEDVLRSCSFGRTARRDLDGPSPGGLSLAVPAANGNYKEFAVPWSLARPLIEAYIANRKAELAALSEKAKCEAAGADYA